MLFEKWYLILLFIWFSNSFDIIHELSQQISILLRFGFALTRSRNAGIKWGVFVVKSIFESEFALAKKTKIASQYSSSTLSRILSFFKFFCANKSKMMRKSLFTIDALSGFGSSFLTWE